MLLHEVRLPHLQVGLGFLSIAQALARLRKFCSAFPGGLSQALLTMSELCGDRKAAHLSRHSHLGGVQVGPQASLLLRIMLRF